MLKIFWKNLDSNPGNHYKQVLTRNEYGQLVERIEFVENLNYGNDETYAIPA